MRIITRQYNVARATYKREALLSSQRIMRWFCIYYWDFTQATSKLHAHSPEGGRAIFFFLLRRDIVFWFRTKDEQS